MKSPIIIAGCIIIVILLLSIVLAARSNSRSDFPRTNIAVIEVGDRFEVWEDQRRGVVIYRDTLHGGMAAVKVRE